jgi:hypothetical protein
MVVLAPYGIPKQEGSQQNNLHFLQLLKFYEYCLLATELKNALSFFRALLARIDVDGKFSVYGLNWLLVTKYLQQNFHWNIDDARDSEE